MNLTLIDMKKQEGNDFYNHRKVRQIHSKAKALTSDTIDFIENATVLEI